MKSEDPKKETIKFKPITKGLGFQPFSNGMPYQSQKSKKDTPTHRYPSGVGAVKAGPPQFVFPETQKKVYRPQSPALDRKKIEEPKISETIVTQPIIEESNGFGYVFKRMAAYLIDATINSVLCLAAFYLTLDQFEIQLADLFSSDIGYLLVAFLWVFNWAVVCAQEIVFQTSIGKRFFNMTLEGNALLILVRSVLYLVGLIPFGIGLIWSIFDKKKRCLHDLLTQIQPKEIALL